VAYLRNNKFIVSCAARTGSTMLVHLLRSNPAILCHGEVFDTDSIGHLVAHYARLRRADPYADAQLFAYRSAHPEAFLYDIVFDLQGSGRRVVGFKFKTDEAFDPAFADVAEVIRRDVDIKVIHLRRRNLLDQYVSHQVVLNQTGVTLLQNDDVPEVSPFTVDVEHLLAYVRDVIDREQRALDVYSGHRGFGVDYEDLVAGIPEVCERMQAFLDVKPVAMTTPTKKILQDNLALVQNLDEVLSALREHGFGERCDVPPERAQAAC
jgi:LPS sulfotransferase NodH